MLDLVALERWLGLCGRLTYAPQPCTENARTRTRRRQDRVPRYGMTSAMPYGCGSAGVGQSIGGVWAHRSWVRAWWLLLHAEVRVPHGFDRRGRPAHLDLRRASSAEEVEQQFARGAGDAGGGFAPPGPDGLGGPR